jgi:hypothetical protein
MEEVADCVTDGGKWATPLLWPEVARPGDYILKSLIDATQNCFFAVIIATPDDTTVSRGHQTPSVRDNLLFELGLFVARVGPRRAVLVAPDDPGVKQFSDYRGVSVLSYTGSLLRMSRDDLRAVGLRIRLHLERELEEAKVGGFVTGAAEPIERLKDRSAVRKKLDGILESVGYSPLRVHQTFFNANPVGRRRDFLERLQKPIQAEVERVVVVSQPIHLHTAHVSVELSRQCNRMNTHLMVAPSLAERQPGVTNYTIIDDHVLLTLPLRTGNVFDRMVENDDGFGGHELEGDSSGIYISNPSVAEALRANVREVGLDVDQYRDHKHPGDDMQILEHARRILSHADVPNGRLLYLHDVALAVSSELQAVPAMDEHLLFVGIVGSVATALWHRKRNLPDPILPPSDLDIVIVFNSLTAHLLETVKGVVTDVCKAFSSNEHIRLEPNYDIAPAKAHHAGEVPLHVLLGDHASIERLWMPYIYHDRRRNHLRLYGKEFPRAEEIGTFTVQQVLDGKHGIRACLRALTENVVEGYKWSGRSNNSVAEVPTSHRIDQDVRLASTFAHYSLYWSIVNLMRASDSPFAADDDPAVLLDIVKFPSGFVPARDMLRRVLSRDAALTEEPYASAAKHAVVGYLRELLTVPAILAQHSKT